MKSENNENPQKPLRRKTPISYYGGKQSMLKHILPNIPKHVHYVEPFFGGGAVFWAKEPSNIEIINDYNDNVVNFYRVMKMRFSELQKIVQSTPFSREIYKNALLIYNTPQAFDPLKRAWSFWVVTNQGFSNQIGSWRSTGLNNKEVVKNTNKREQFTTELARRLDKVQIECKDAVELIKSKDSKDTFFYIDPPYVGSNQGHYGGYTQEHFNELLTALKSIKGKFILSSYPNATLQNHIKTAKWNTQNLKMALNASNTLGKTKTEVLTANFSLIKTPSASKPSSKPISAKSSSQSSTSINGIHPRKKSTMKTTENAPKVIELAFIEKYCMLHEKTVSSIELTQLFNDLQYAIVQKKIRATSKYATEIREIQNSLIGLLHKLKSSDKVSIEIYSVKRNQYLALIGKEYLLNSVKFIEDYIDFQGKSVPTSSVKELLREIQKAIKTKSVHSQDPNFSHIQQIVIQLQNFIKSNPKQGWFHIKSQQLNGLKRCKGMQRNRAVTPKKRIVSKHKRKAVGTRRVQKATGTKRVTSKTTRTKSLNGFEEERIMNSMDVLPLRFDSLGFKGIWLDFLGNPAKGFTAMVSGKPKLGKSSLCLNFAGYLAKHHGKVLYVAREEKIGDTFQKKLIDAQVAHPNLDVIGVLPKDISKYDFLFLDSVTKLGLTPHDLEQLKINHPELSIIGIYQVTKEGVFRGNNSYQHDVDIVIEVPELGVAKQFGRYNQGASMCFFQPLNNQTNEN